MTGMSPIDVTARRRQEAPWLPEMSQRHRQERTAVKPLQLLFVTSLAGVNKGWKHDKPDQSNGEIVAHEKCFNSVILIHK